MDASNSSLKKFILGKMYKLTNSERELLDSVDLGHLPEEFDDSIRGVTRIEPFSGQTFSKNPTELARFRRKK